MPEDSTRRWGRILHEGGEFYICRSLPPETSARSGEIFAWGKLLFATPAITLLSNDNNSTGTSLYDVIRLIWDQTSIAAYYDYMRLILQQSPDALDCVQHS